MNVSVKPRVRMRGLIVTPRAGELMIFDLERRFAHRLGRFATRVWKLIDGNRTAEEIARALNRSGRSNESRKQVIEVLKQLRKARLLGGAARRDLDRLLGRPANGSRDGRASSTALFVRTIDCDVRRRARRPS